MCKPSCCPGNGSSGLGAIAIIAGIVVVAAIARPMIDAAEVILRIALISLSVVMAIAIITTGIVLAMRLRRDPPNFVAGATQRPPIVLKPVASLSDQRRNYKSEILTHSQVSDDVVTGTVPATRLAQRCANGKPTPAHPTGHARRWS